VLSVHNRRTIPSIAATTRKCVIDLFDSQSRLLPSNARGIVIYHFESCHPTITLALPTHHRLTPHHPVPVPTAPLYFLRQGDRGSNHAPTRSASIPIKLLAKSLFTPDGPLPIPLSPSTSLIIPLIKCASTDMILFIVASRRSSRLTRYSSLSSSLQLDRSTFT